MFFLLPLCFVLFVCFAIQCCDWASRLWAEVAVSGCWTLIHTTLHREYSRSRWSGTNMFIIWMICRAESLSFLFLARQLHRVRSSLRCRCFFFSPCAIFIEISQRRRTKKFYLALLRGHLEQDRVDIDIPIGETRTNTIAYPNKFGKWHFIFSSWEDLINAKTSACFGLYWYVCF